MNVILIVALSNIAIALLIIGLSIPLIYRKVSMNPLYGVRFSASFRSTENWYSINEYGGRALLFASIPIGLYGILGTLIYSHTPDWYLWLSAPVTLIPLIIATWMSYKRATQVDNQNG